MLLSRADNLSYNQLKTDFKNDYMMGIGRYPQNLPVSMQLLNNYITEIGKNRNFRKISGKEQKGVDFTQIQ